MEAAVCPQTGFASRAGLAQLFERVDPGLCRLFAGGADVQGLLLHEYVQRDVAHTASFGDDVPFDRLHRIGMRAATDCKNVGKTVLRNRVALARRLANTIAAICSFWSHPFH